jgi:hypothetical protein
MQKPGATPQDGDRPANFPLEPCKGAMRSKGQRPARTHYALSGLKRELIFGFVNLGRCRRLLHCAHFGAEIVALSVVAGWP